MITNRDLGTRTDQKPITNTVIRRLWKWNGHTPSRDESNIARHEMDLDQGIVVDPQMRGAEESKDLIETNMSWCAAKRTSQDPKGYPRLADDCLAYAYKFLASVLL